MQIHADNDELQYHGVTAFYRTLCFARELPDMLVEAMTKQVCAAMRQFQGDVNIQEQCCAFFYQLANEATITEYMNIDTFA